jgi:hypothetical protein
VAVVTATTGLWIAVGVLGALLIGGLAAGFLLLAMGRLHLDLGWGRSLHELGPIELEIAAPRELVFKLISEPYLGHTPEDSKIEVLARGEGLAVAAHLSKVHFYEARTVEAVEFEAPARVGFRHLTGPVPYAVEQFELSESEGGTTLRYGGEVGIDFYLLGRIAGRHWVVPQWERVVRKHLEDVKARAEELQRRRRLRSRSAIEKES